MLSLLLELMVSVFSESDISSIRYRTTCNSRCVLFFLFSSLHLSVPQFKSPFVSVPGQSLSEDGLALFLHHSLFLAAKTLYQVGIQVCSSSVPLTIVAGDICSYIRTCLCANVCTKYPFSFGTLYVCMYVCMYVCTYVCMCTYVCTYVCIKI